MERPSLIRVLRLGGSFLGSMLWMSSAFSTECPPGLIQRVLHPTSTAAKSKRVLSQTEIDAYENLVFGAYESLPRAQSNGLGLGASRRERDAFLDEKNVDILHLFREVHQDIFDDVDGKVVKDSEGMEVDLFAESPLIGDELRAPVLSAEEIRSRQGAIKELVGDPQVKEALDMWRDKHGVFFGAVTNEGSIINYYRSARQDLSDLESPYAPVRILARARSLETLPKTFEALSRSLEGSSDLRLSQISTEAALLAKSRWLSGIQEKLKSAGFEAGKKDYERAELVEIANLLQEVAKDDVLKQFQFVGEDATRLALLSDVAKQTGWTTYADIYDPKDNKAFVELHEAHNPRVLSKANEQSVANDLALGGLEPNGAIVTGLNAKGKSTTGRTALQLMLLSQLGLPIPAESMKFTPMNLYRHSNPQDAPDKGNSGLVNQAKSLYENVMARANQNSHQLIVLDEVLPGSTQEVRTAAEINFLKRLADTGSLVLVSTHNWGLKSVEDATLTGTPTLAVERPDLFKNLHVTTSFKLQNGPQSSQREMLEEGANALRRAGWPEDWIEDYLRQSGLAP